MILMDTCAIIWDALDQQQITPVALKAINNADVHNALIISDMSIWDRSMTLSPNPLHWFLLPRSIR